MPAQPVANGTGIMEAINGCPNYLTVKAAHGASQFIGKGCLSGSINTVDGYTNWMVRIQHPNLLRQYLN